jgi:hypothetical protein
VAVGSQLIDRSISVAGHHQEHGSTASGIKNTIDRYIVLSGGFIAAGKLKRTVHACVRGLFGTKLNSAGGRSNGAGASSPNLAAVPRRRLCLSDGRQN